jgi:hypothetical protein
MDLTFTEREAAFRDELRAWFAANDPGPEPRDSSAASTRAAGRRRTGRRSTAGAERR